MFHQEQSRAIEHIDGPALILAGPGSGKTTVIVERVNHLIEKESISPEKILVVTFTKAAAIHMEQRFQKKQKNVRPVTFGTFHSVFYRILKDAYHYRGERIIAEKEKIGYIKQCIARLKIDFYSQEEYVTNVLNEIGKVKGNLIDIDSYESLCCGSEEFRKIYREYEKILRVEGKMDFDDILIQTKELLCNNEKVLKEWRELYSYILIDEFQDINKVQYDIIRLLAEPANNLFVVGDDDQSIYGFRGSKPEMMFRFKEDFPGTKEIRLGINYRCNESIVEASKKLIENNKIRFEKNLRANRKGKKEIDIRKFKNQGEELRYIVKEIRRLKSEGIMEEEIAVLVRNNSQIPVIQRTLQNNRIGSRRKKQGDELYNGMVLKDILAYMKAAKTIFEKPINENEDLIYVLNKPERLISREVILQKGMTVEKLKEEYKHHEEALRQIEVLIFHLKMIAKLHPYAAINYIRRGVGYEEYLKQYAKDYGFEGKVLIEQLEKIQSQSYNFGTFEEWMDMILEKQNSRCDTKKGVQLLTMHGAKGLEFYAVFLPDVNHGIIPSKKILREKDFEEERRVFYVAMTRAIEELHIYGIMEQLGAPMELSMFLNELTE